MRRLPSLSRYAARASLHPHRPRGHERGLHTGHPLVVGLLYGQRRRLCRVPRRFPHRHDAARHHGLRGPGCDAFDHLHVYGRRLRPRQRSFRTVGAPHGHHAGRVTRIRPGRGSLDRIPRVVVQSATHRARSGRRSPGRLVQPVRRYGPGAGLGQRQWSLDPLGLDDVGRIGRHRALLPAEIRPRASGAHDQGRWGRAGISTGGGRPLPQCGPGGRARPSRGLGRPGNRRQRGPDRSGPRRRAGGGGRSHQQRAGVRHSWQQPDGALRPRRAERERLLRPGGHPVLRRRPAAR